MGDARGHWEGNTLVVETTNFRQRSAYRNAAADTLRLTERFTPTAPGRIDWTVTVDDAPRPNVRIDDDGVGLDPADVPRLLLPFQSQKAGGYGLGLPLTRKIALLHNARLELTGRPGEGARATVEFFGAEATPALQFVTTKRT